MSAGSGLENTVANTLESGYQRKKDSALTKICTFIDYCTISAPNSGFLKLITLAGTPGASMANIIKKSHILRIWRIGEPGKDAMLAMNMTKWGLL